MNLINDRVSIIIPAYNRAKYIECAIESCLRQDYSDIEIIVVDDGSKDGTFDILFDYQSCEKIKLLYHEGRVNRGQSASINLGLSAASGEFVVILDSDDYLSAGVVARHVSYLSENCECGLVYGMGAAVDSEGRSLNFNTLSDFHVESGDPNNLLLNCYIALPGGSMVRSSVYKKIGGFVESFRAGQDHDMALRIFESTKVAYLPEVAFFYRKHEDAISARGLERRWRIGFEILNRARMRYPYRQNIVRKRLAVLYFRLALVVWEDRNFFYAICYFLRAGLLDPARSLRVIAGQEKVK